MRWTEYFHARIYIHQGLKRGSQWQIFQWICLLDLQGVPPAFHPITLKKYSQGKVPVIKLDHSTTVHLPTATTYNTKTKKPDRDSKYTEILSKAKIMLHNVDDAAFYNFI